MKKIIAILLMMVMLVMLVFGCVSRQDYDSLMVEYDALMARVESAESNLTAAQGQVQTFQSDLATEQGKSAKLGSDLAAEQSKAAKLETDLTEAQAQIGTLGDDLDKAESDLATAQIKVSKLEGVQTELRPLWDSLQKKLAVQQAIVDFWSTVSLLAAGEISETEATLRTLVFMGMGPDIEEVGDAELSQLWEDFITYAQQGKEAKMLSSLGALTERVSDLIDQDIEALEAQLSSAPVPAPAPAPPPAPAP